MKRLDERGLAENTIVIFMGDNGEALLRGKTRHFERSGRLQDPDLRTRRHQAVSNARQVRACTPGMT